VADDLPWLDRASATVLGVVARRLAGHRVGFLAGSRAGEDGYFARLDRRALGIRAPRIMIGRVVDITVTATLTLATAP
jgi:hypothetical protein